MRRVCHEWYGLFEHAVMEHINTKGSQILVRAGPKPTTTMSVALNCVGYDPKTGIFTFKPADVEKPLVCERRSLRQVKILFGEWNGVAKTLHNTSSYVEQNPIVAGLSNTGPLEVNSVTAEALSLYANLKFHVDYIEAVQKEFQVSEKGGMLNLPSDPGDLDLAVFEQDRVAFLGDRDVILKSRVRYVLSEDQDPVELASVRPEYLTVSFSVDFVQVRSSWIFSGLSTFSPMPCHQIYEERYALLDQLVLNPDVQSYNRHSSNVLEWVASEAGANDEETFNLVEHIKATSGDFDTGALLAKALEAKGVTQHHMWKFGIVKRFLADPEGSSMTFDQIVEKVVLTQSSHAELSTPSSNNSNGSENKLFRWSFARFS